MANTYVIIDTKEEIDHIKMKIKQVMNFFKTKPLIKNSTHMFFENGKKIIFLEDTNNNYVGKVSLSLSQRFKYYREKENVIVYGWFKYYINYNNYGTLSEYENYLRNDQEIEIMICDLVGIKNVNVFFENKREQRNKKLQIKSLKFNLNKNKIDLIELKEKIKNLS